MAMVMTFPMPSISVLGCSSSRRRQLGFPRTEALAGLSLPLSTATSPSNAVVPLVYCGRGDKKTAKGKRFKHSFGNARPRNKHNGRGPPRSPVPPSPEKKDRFDGGEIVKIEIDESLFS